MSKKMYFKLIVFLVIINMLLKPSIYATVNQVEKDAANVNIEENVNVEKKDELEKEKKQKEELNGIIKELTKSIKSKIKTIDEKIEYIRTIEEYENYPAIRLNVDTPIFGLASITNSKLKIKQEVCATDIAKGYSLRYIIKNNSIKLPEKYIAGIIVSTKDVKFDENISLTDANLAVRKLMQYSKTADNIIEFLNNQTNKIFRGYIDKNKSQNLAEIKRKLNKLNEDLLKQDEKLITMHIILTNEESRKVYTAKVESFNEISKKIKENENEAKNILISDEEMIKLQKSVLELETKMIDYSIELDKILEDELKNVNEEQMLIAISDELKTKRENLEKVLKNSVKKEEINNTDDNQSIKEFDENDVEESSLGNNSQTKVDVKNNEENQNENPNNKNTNSGVNDNITIQEIEIYEVVSKDILTDIDEEVIKPLDEKLKKYVKETEDKNKENEGKQNSENAQNAENNDVIENIENVDNQEKVDKIENKISAEEKKQLVNDMVKLYKNFILKENKFYLDNINNTLKNTTSRLSDLSKYTKYDILNQMRYIYLELPSSLENYLDSTNLSSTIETRRLSNNFNKELNNLLNVYIKINEIYIELNKNQENNA